MKKLNFAIILIGLTTLSLKSNATPVINGSKTSPIDSAKKTTVDPVCKMKVKAQTTKTTVYNKVTYSFCSESCKHKFVAEPTKYIKSN
jgi:YHS domain-containing protein